jgi:hypothetical protein
MNTYKILSQSSGRVSIILQYNLLLHMLAFLYVATLMSYKGTFLVSYSCSRHEGMGPAGLPKSVEEV